MAGSQRAAPGKAKHRCFVPGFRSYRENQEFDTIHAITISECITCQCKGSVTATADFDICYAHNVLKTFQT
jgi:hypothetical protein